MSDQPLLDRPVTRRAVLVGGSLAGFSAFLAACGTQGTASSPTPGQTATAPPAGTPAATSAPPTTPPVRATYSTELNWANWCCYLDVDPADKTKWKTLEDFKKKYGTTVNYKEVIDANEGFVATIANQIVAGQDPGWDIITVTDWMVARLIRLGWLEKFETANMPNFVANVRDVYKAQTWDAAMAYHAPWQTGMTGIGADTTKTGEITSVKSLFEDDPRWHGKVEFLTEMRDAIGLSMLALGLDPRTPTRDGADKAVALMKRAQAAKTVRDVKGNAYTEDLAAGVAVLVMAWSGDIVGLQAEAPNLKFIFPTEGVMFWTDNVCIPKGAVHKGTAELLIDYCYVPENAAQIEAGVAYVTPVKGVQEIFAASADNKALATDPLRFPPAGLEPKLVPFGILSDEDETYFNEQFATVIGD
ncbi:MAG: extracellular solute-binding protein [Chloroflexi bacterium]|nr:extracellular solute-binding protein [Chloroflexota bacterium]